MSMPAALRLLSLSTIKVAQMAHKRIRKFNTKHTYPEQKLDNDLAQAVVTQGGKIVWLRGQCAQNLDDAVSVGGHDPVQQTHKVMQNMRQLIEEAGGKMEHLVKIVVLTAAIAHRGPRDVARWSEVGGSGWSAASIDGARSLGPHHTRSEKRTRTAEGRPSACPPTIRPSTIPQRLRGCRERSRSAPPPSFPKSRKTGE